MDVTKIISPHSLALHEALMIEGQRDQCPEKELASLLPSGVSRHQVKNQFSDYTESEFLDLMADIVEANGSEEYQDQLLEHFIQITEHPSGSDLIYYPENPADATPKRILETVKEWRARNGLPSFKS